MKAVVDQISEGVAVLLGGDDGSIKLHLPVACLPAGTREGNVVQISITRDAEETASRKARIQELLDDLPNEP